MSRWPKNQLQILWGRGKVYYPMLLWPSTQPSNFGTPPQGCQGHNLLPLPHPLLNLTFWEGGLHHLMSPWPKIQPSNLWVENGASPQMVYWIGSVRPHAGQWRIQYSGQVRAINWVDLSTLQELKRSKYTTLPLSDLVILFGYQFNIIMALVEMSATSEDIDILYPNGPIFLTSWTSGLFWNEQNWQRGNWRIATDTLVGIIKW